PRSRSRDTWAMWKSSPASSKRIVVRVARDQRVREEPDMDRQLEVGGILDEALDLYSNHWRPLLTLAGIFAFIGAVIAGIAQMAPTGRPWWLVLLAALTIIISGMLSGMSTLLVADIRDGKKVETLGEIFSRTTPRLGALIITWIVVGLAIIVGGLIGLIGLI